LITEFQIENFENDGIFFTDSNGLDMMKRALKLDRTQTKDPKHKLSQEYSFSLGPGFNISENYYPIPSTISIFDIKNK
jgi:hypothetical protein